MGDSSAKPSDIAAPGDAKVPARVSEDTPDSLLTTVADLLTTRHHSRDFSGARAIQIGTRIRDLAAVLLVLLVVWIPVDYVVVPWEVFWKLALTRTAAAVLLAGIWSLEPRVHKLADAYARMAALVAILTAFYVFTRLAVDDLVAAGALTGYTFLPFILVMLQALFPFAIVEAIAFSAPVLIAGVSVEAYTRSLFDLSTLGDIWLLGALVGVAWWVQAGQLNMLLRLYRQATRDPLTGLHNRRVLMERLSDEVRRAKRYGHPLTLLIMDLDRFKRINDAHGHLAGDAVLRIFAETTEEALRNTDMLGRYGGEEFLAILPETDVDLASEAAERIRLACHDSTAESPDGRRVAFTTSIGLAELAAGEDGDELLQRVDEALFAAKVAGRDRVYLAEEPKSKVAHLEGMNG